MTRICTPLAAVTLALLVTAEMGLVAGASVIGVALAVLIGLFGLRELVELTGRLADAEDRSRRREALFRGIFENTSAGVALTDASGKYITCNPAFAAMVGRTTEDVLTLSLADVVHPDDWAVLRPLLDEVRGGRRDRVSCLKRYRRPDGQIVWVELSYSAVRGANGELECGVSVSLNVTERRKLEEQRHEVQKLEALRQLAGGIAHDFNNLLTVVLCSLAEVRLPPDDPHRVHLVAVEQAVTRAADLTAKLLGYARKNQLLAVPVDPADAFAEALDELRPSLDPRIRTVVRRAEPCDPVLADPTLLVQLLLNLCRNSVEAMPEGGILTLAAEPVTLTADEVALLPGEARAGRFVRLTVADTGHGMTEDVKARVFEPYFTTKGKSSGLGLPMVLGIVKQHQGWLTFTSAPGDGTRFDVYLPVAPSPSSVPGPPAVAPTPTPPDSLQPESGTSERRTILLVDDELMILEIGRHILEQAGFRVVTAPSGAEAVELFRSRPDRFDLVILDVTMPEMSGREVFRQLVTIAPGVKVLFSTGYSAEDLVELEGAAGLLAKPYRPNDLLNAVQAALAGPAPAADGPPAP